ncbi:hypothetical protein EIP91_006468 [Steccherinum ochraceum]|uniref:Uncharacterized protein n=1 Tax=Steccherinum ochraceum TaxID=92696 RepID=A0A4R0RM91_9APHY|nr:hypothetical protein EIP91_006468 [Steccherinum ochraceum]
MQALRAMVTSRTVPVLAFAKEHSRRSAHTPSKAKNPFLRKTERGSMQSLSMDPALKSPSRVANRDLSKRIEPFIPDLSSGRSSEDNRSEGDDPGPEPGDGGLDAPVTSKSTFKAPPPTTKALRPISRLSVPSFPTSCAPSPANQRERRDAPDVNRRRSTGSGLQTKLALSTPKTPDPAAPSVKKRPDPSRMSNTLSSIKAAAPSDGSVSGGRITRRKSTGGSSTAAGFDWTQWSAKK